VTDFSEFQFIYKFAVVKILTSGVYEHMITANLLLLVINPIYSQLPELCIPCLMHLMAIESVLIANRACFMLPVSTAGFNHSYWGLDFTCHKSLLSG
jgi:hypothetical protein